MAYVPLAVSIILSVVAYWSWGRFIGARLPARKRLELAEQSLPDLPGIIAAFLPRKLRQFWNLSWMWLAVLVLGLPHILVVRSFLLAREYPSLLVHYLWTLVYWLVLLALPAGMMAMHRRARQQTGN